MKRLELNTIKQIYGKAIDANVGNKDSVVWWNEVAIEIRNVIAAPTNAAGAEITIWWHADWSLLNDSPIAAATCLREVARAYA